MTPSLVWFCLQNLIKIILIPVIFHCFLQHIIKFAVVKSILNRIRYEKNVIFDGKLLLV